jgi:ubiquinone/menaquinone biosynthesis C-methylase UbiE
MVGHSLNPTTRFSDRVNDYVKYRPGYPPEMLQFFITKLGLKPSDVVADIGSGTGISTEVFLRNSNRVFAIEPNAEMRAASDRLLVSYPNFISVDGSSEATGLKNQTCDFVVVAQAFHWMEPAKTKREFRRILKDQGYVALIWNDRQVAATGFSAEYEKLILQFAIDYEAVNHKGIDQAAIRMFLGSQMGTVTFPNQQRLDFDGMLGRVTSSSYMPNKTHANFSAMAKEFRDLFIRYSTDGKVTIAYDTQIFYARW